MNFAESLSRLSIIGCSDGQAEKLLRIQADAEIARAQIARAPAEIARAQADAEIARAPAEIARAQAEIARAQADVEKYKGLSTAAKETILKVEAETIRLRRNSLDIFAADLGTYVN